MAVPPFSPDGSSRLRRVASASWERAGDELFLIDLGSGDYFRLDEVGAFVWERLDGATDLTTLAGQVACAWDVDAVRAEADLVALAGSLLGAGLVEKA